jgi:hypothetical protein
MFLMEPQRVRCSVYTEVTSSVDFDAEPGESYYVKESFHSGITDVRIRLESVPASDAQTEIGDCKEQ